MTMNSKQLTQQPEDRHDDPKREDPKQTPRRNPRLVYGDPDKFFRDLLMEQQEQS